MQQQQQPQACGPGKSRVVLLDSRQWKVYILLVSAFHMPLQHALRLVLAFYSIESWNLQTFAMHTPPPLASSSPPWNWIGVCRCCRCCCSCQLPGPMHRPNRKYIRVSLHLPLHPLPPHHILSCLHRLRFQNCKLDLLNFSKLQQQEANRQRLAKVLPNSLQPIITWKITHTPPYTLIFTLSIYADWY